jgi:hypothetical protein
MLFEQIITLIELDKYKSQYLLKLIVILGGEKEQWLIIGMIKGWINKQIDFHKTQDYMDKQDKIDKIKQEFN